MTKWMSLVCVLFSITASAAPSLEWQFIKTDNGITLHSRNHSDGLVEIRTQMFVPTSYSAFLLLLEDSERVPKWIDNVSHSKVLKQLSANENVVYTQFSAPWPAKDRDMVTYSQYALKDGALRLEIYDAPNYLPEQSGYIRITQVKANWTLQKLTDGMTHIEYIAFANPGGALPDWLVNKLSVNSAFATFQGLRRELPAYQGKPHPNLQE
ncbi:START domain-containing protein [Vibrio aestuarianus]|uniref:START domain-containing protein n=1 Tax=Vibrio aestuarianus TaxID=28171 RepID=UPI00237C6E20|nr:START domain-containing protein [Vibrio aestuarianus]MDE1326394.1 START domain-containing protein [Vibrio aestuarianus]